MRVPILCYHSHIITSAGYAGNAHVALAKDLVLIAEQGKTIIPLYQLVNQLINPDDDFTLDNTVVLTFDDGSKADFMPVEHPQYGPQPGLYPLMQQHAQQHQQAVHATSFVIACPQARQRMDQECLFKLDWMNDDWWSAAEASGMLNIESHSWNHNNAVCDDVPAGSGDQFYSINDYHQADRQVREAAESIAAISGRYPDIFAYPYGHISEYLQQTYFPEFKHEHRMRCALSTQPEYVTVNTPRWAIPRFVHGEHWRDPKTLTAIINGEMQTL